MTDAPPLHPSIVALVALSANIAANSPRQGLCQLQRLRDLGVPEGQIAAVIEIARHIRDEAGQMLDQSFDEQAGMAAPAATETGNESESGSCCTPTASGQSCC